MSSPAAESANLYDILGLKPDCEQGSIIKAFRRRALRQHPDKGGDTAAFQRLAQAYAVLSNPESRKRYDSYGDFDDASAQRPRTAEDIFFESFFGDEARGSDSRSADYRIHSLNNYEELNLKEVDPYFTDIAKVGLNYMASLELDSETEIVLLRHSRIDMLYVMAAYKPPLTQQSWDDARHITYYDNPTQGGIRPAWSDQQSLNGRKKKLHVRRELTAEEFQRRLDAEQSAENVQDALERKYAMMQKIA